MNSTKHSKHNHALFSPSKSTWIRYTDEQMEEFFYNSYRTSIGTELHEFASQEIRLKHKYGSVKNVRYAFETFLYSKYYLEDYDTITDFGKNLLRHIKFLPKESFDSVKEFINDGIGFMMQTEAELTYSDNFWGTTDAYCFRDNTLRIHDLKTGSGPVKMDQLEIYAGLFCLEHKKKPKDINIELRIYQLGEIIEYAPEPEEIDEIVATIVHGEKIVSRIQNNIEKEFE